MKHNKRGQTEDFTDWVILVIGLLFLMIFLQLAVLKPLEDKAQESVNLFENNGKVNDYLVQKRAEMEKGTAFTKEQLDQGMFFIRSPSPEPVMME